MASVINQIKFNDIEYAIAASAYAECSTAGTEAAKKAWVITDGDATHNEFSLVRGVSIKVRFWNPNIASHITLDVNGTGPKTIMYNGNEIPVEYIKPNRIYEFIYSGVWELVGDVDTNTAHGHTGGVGIAMTDGDGGISGTVGYKAKLRSETALSVDSSAVTTTSGRVYPVAVDKSGYLAVNVPWTDSNTDTKVTQTVTTTDANYPLLLAPSGQTATKTTTSYFDSGVTLNPSTNTIAANISGNAGTATKLATARTISLTGDVTGSATFDGSGDASITATVANDSHNHTVLNGKTSSGIDVDAADGTLRYDYNIVSTATGLFPTMNNANAIITINKHSGAYDSQLGFSANGNLYYRNFNAANNDTATVWKQIAFTDSKVSSASSADSVAWSNVSGRPTKVSQFSNDSGYLTKTFTYSSTSSTITAQNNYVITHTGSSYTVTITDSISTGGYCHIVIPHWVHTITMPSGWTCFYSNFNGGGNYTEISMLKTSSGEKQYVILTK